MQGVRPESDPTVASLLSVNDAAVLVVQVLLSATERFRDACGLSFDTVMTDIDSAFVESFTTAREATLGLQSPSAGHVSALFSLPKVGVKAAAGSSVQPGKFTCVVFVFVMVSSCLCRHARALIFTPWRFDCSDH